MTMADGQDHLLEQASDALRKMRPKRRKVGIVRSDGTVEPVIEDEAWSAPRHTAEIVAFQAKPDCLPAN